MDTVKERWVSLNRLIETSKLKTQRKKKRMKMVEELWDNYKRCNISIMGIPEGEERKEQMQRIYSKWERVNTFSFNFFHSLREIWSRVIIWEWGQKRFRDVRRKWGKHRREKRRKRDRERERLGEDVSHINNPESKWHSCCQQETRTLHRNCLKPRVFNPANQKSIMSK